MNRSAIFMMNLSIVGLQFALIVPSCKGSGHSSAVIRDGSSQQPATVALSALPASQNAKSASTHTRDDRVATPSIAKALQVTYNEGELTIVAEDVSLSDALSEIRRVTGADIDIPATAAAQRIWVRFGPGPARNVLRDLLDGTNLDYVIQASDIDEDGIRSVSLTARGKNTDVAAPVGQVARTTNLQAQPAADEPETQERNESATAANREPAPPSAPPPTAPRIASTTPVREDSSLAPLAPMAGSSEQMAQQLQNLYQQRRQMQMQQNQKTGQSPVSN